MNRQTKLSVAIIALNEADRLNHCIRSVQFADEIVLVDSGSRDQTPEIARAAGCRVFAKAFAGFGPQKQFAVDQCRHDWVLLVDADEKVPPGTAATVREALCAPDPQVAAFSLQRKNFLHNRWIRHCGWWPDRLVRLVDRRRGRFSPDTVHERWLPDGPVHELSCAIEHHSFRGYADMLDKLQRYSTLGAQTAAARGRIHAWSPVLHGAWTFFQTYAIKLGMLDGFDGLMIALLHAGGSLMKYAKARELREFAGTHDETAAER